MESANFHHHQLQEDHQFFVDSSCYGLSWYQNPILNNTNTRDMKQYISAQDINESPWSTTCSSISMEGFLAHEQQQHLARIKHEISVSGSYPGLSENISSSPSSNTGDFMSKNNDQRIRYIIDNNQDMFLKTFSNRCQIESDHLMNQIPLLEESISYSNDTNSCYRGTFSQILPTINVSNLNQSSTPPFDGSLSFQSSSLNVHNLGGFFEEDCLSYGFDQMHSKISPAFIVETAEAKRPASDYMDRKANSKATPPKKSKLELRPSCTPLKVRKEKLGDRISALQQMVAPFGKTDTASVLMEAIGYIKFLQNQVETLSVPYMNSTRTGSKISTREGSIENGNKLEMKRDLRSRGLCLVPLPCLSYVTYGGGRVWATP